MLIALDNIIWSKFFPKIKIIHFENKLICYTSLLYLCLFSLPRKFILHYFFGKGGEKIIDTKYLIYSNPFIRKKVIEYLKLTNNNFSGNIHFSQTQLSNPNHRYSIGSFTLFYTLNNNILSFSLKSYYRFHEHTNRITKHLHNWLFNLKEKGYANDFLIYGNNFSIPLNYFLNQKIILKDGPWYSPL